MIDYKKDLNPAQYEAATTLEGPVLVIAGAGSGKTRTIVYRLARLVESGVPASAILLLTFTRKAAQEMLDRARLLLDQRGMPSLAEPGREGIYAGLAAVQGGTFHSFAYSLLRLFQPEGYGKRLTVMDGHDILACLQHCRDSLNIGKGDRSFPKNQTIQSYLSKSRNKEQSLEDILHREAFHLLMHADAMGKLADAYAAYKREKSLLDYDDLLFTMERVLVECPEALAYCRNRYRYIMVDEYQDTNPVQARIAALVAGSDPLPGGTATAENTTGGTTTGGTITNGTFAGGAPGNIMVVGDDAQSIYAFRGADVRNILRFPDLFPGTRLIRLEENYRSTQPVLDLSNNILANAEEGFDKRLFTRLEGGEKPAVVRPLSDRSEAALAAARIVDLLDAYPPHEIAVLFRAGFHSYALELQLNKLGIAFRKYGGIRYTDAAHIKDVMSFARLVLNPLDFTAFARMAELSKGVGSRTCLKLYQLALAGDSAGLAKAALRHMDLRQDLAFLDELRAAPPAPSVLLSRVVDHYRPRLEALYPDDYPRRLQGLEELVSIAAPYADLDLLVADLSLEDPLRDQEERDSVTLSTIHSAKGLEWSAVLLIDLVEERFPSRHAQTRPEDFEEERRLMYVACTRAKRHLTLYVPASLYDRGSGGSIPAVPSPFVRELSPALYAEWQEGYTGALVEKKRERAAVSPTPAALSAPRQSAIASRSGVAFTIDDDAPALGEFCAPTAAPANCGFCRHRIFGRGKIVQHLPPDKYRVNFPGMGLKVIMAAFLTIEE